MELGEHEFLGGKSCVVVSAGPWLMSAVFCVVDPFEESSMEVK